MQRPNWLNPLITCAAAALALSACGDDAPTNVDSGTDDATESDTDPTTGTPGTTTDMTTGVDSTGSTGDPSVCGDGVVDGGELCDDGNTDEGDGCDATCQVEGGFDCDDAEPSTCSSICGDGLVVAGELCDDGNTDAGDGCDAACEPENGFECDDAEPSVCAGVCGDGIVVSGEECDDSNTDPDDGCDAACVVEAGWACGMEPSVCETGCGDGIVVGMELCDDGNLEPDDGCSARCTPELGWNCMGEPSSCTEECGDGLIVGAEICDDGGVGTGDGCDDLCMVESGYYCTGEPSDCDTQCGDGLVAGTEICDDGNIAQGDGCGPTCLVEFAYTCDMAEPSGCSITELYADVAMGFEGGCILTQSGIAACFGNNSDGQVGNGTIDVETFLPVAALDQVVSIHAGDEHMCAIRMGGEVWCWGDNLNQAMGPLSMPPNDESTPLQITGLPPIVDMDAGFDHNCAIDGAGTVWCWGDNDNRQLGRGGTTTTDDVNPGAVLLPLGQPAIDLGLGENHSCAVLANNTVACWGDDDSGQLGDGVVNPDTGDAQLVPGLVNIVEVEAGRDATCAIDNLGGLWCWGNNEDGQVGNGTNTDIAIPQPIALPQPVDAVTLGTEFACAVTVTDQVYCWGEGSDFQLGYGDYISQNTPIEVTDVPAGDIIDIEAGSRMVCLELAAGERWCWGYSEEGQLGIAPLNQLDLTDPLAFSAPLVELFLSEQEYRGVICGVLADGTVECAGDGTVNLASITTGAFGFFNDIHHHLAELTPNPGLTGVLEMAMGDGALCYRTAVDVQCYGDNSNRQLGQGGTTTVDIYNPIAVMTLGTVDEIEAGDQFFCVRTGGVVACWGDNDSYQTGVDGSTTDQSLPVVVPVINDALDIELGENHACALRAGGVVSCWGDDGASQLGDNDMAVNDSGIPVDVTGLPGPADELGVGQDHACARVGTEVWCWGDATYGQLGQGDEVDSDTAVLVPGLPNIVQISVGNNYTCAIDDTADVWCWGYGLDGQLGNGGEELTNMTEFLSPVHFDVASGVTDVLAGNGTTCVETALGWQCLGFRSSGQLGDGTTVEPALPHPMLFGL